MTLLKNSFCAISGVFSISMSLSLLLHQRAHHFVTVFLVTFCSLATLLLVLPDASSTIILARCTKPWGDLGQRMKCFKFFLKYLSN